MGDGANLYEGSMIIDIQPIIGILSDGTSSETGVDSVRLGGSEIGVIEHRVGATLCLTQWISAADRRQLENGLAAARKASGIDDSPMVNGNPMHPAKAQSLLDQLDGGGDE
jgi:hypothetical protein